MGLIAIGDVHGCAESLAALIDTLDLQAGDHLVFVGDYVDRGPNSKSVIDQALKLRDEYECVFLRGNHEAMMLDYLDRGEFELWRMNGGLDTLDSYRGADGRVQIPESHIEFVRETELFYETEDFFFVHAGLRADLTVAENVEREEERVFLWERGHLDAKDRDWEKTVVCGHTPHSEPINEEDLILIDTGCVYTRHPGMARLTAVRLPERDFVFVPYSG